MLTWLVPFLNLFRDKAPTLLPVTPGQSSVPPEQIHTLRTIGRTQEFETALENSREYFLRFREDLNLWIHCSPIYSGWRGRVSQGAPWAFGDNFSSKPSPSHWEKPRLQTFIDQRPVLGSSKATLSMIWRGTLTQTSLNLVTD